MFSNSTNLNEKIQRHEDGTIERWRDIPGYQKTHRASDKGRIKALPRSTIHLYKGIYLRKHTVKGKIVKGHMDNKGYVSVSLRGDNPKKVHRIILETFIGPCPKGMECRHLNGNPSDNRLENICWGTHKENIEDRYRHGTVLFGEQNRNSKLTNDQAREIYRLYSTGKYAYHEIAKMFSVTVPSIARIVIGDGFKNLNLPPLVGKYARGHSPKNNGSQHANAKLTGEQVKEVRRAFDINPSADSKRVLAKKYGLDPETVRMIGVRKRYKDVPEE